MCILLSQQNSVLSDIPIVDKGKAESSQSVWKTWEQPLAHLPFSNTITLSCYLCEAVILILKGHY